MVAVNKYGAKQVYYDWQSDYVLTKEAVEQYRRGKRVNLPFWIHRFDSQHEFRVFNKLKDMYGKDRIQLQIPVRLFSHTLCHKNGKDWKVDFMVTDGNNPLIPLCYVEAKGVMNKEFEFILSVLEQNNPRVFNNLHIVFADKIPSRNQVIKNLLTTNFANRIYKRTRFNQLTELT